MEMEQPQKKSLFKRVHMVVWILLGTLIGGSIGLALSASEANSEWAIWLGMPGTIWMRCLKLMVLPLVFCAVVTAVTGLDDIGVGTSTIARNTVILYTITTLWGVGEGLAVTFALKPIWSGANGAYVTVKPHKPAFDSGARINVYNADAEGFYTAETANKVMFTLPEGAVDGTVTILSDDLMYYYEKTISFNMPTVLDADGRPVSGDCTDFKIYNSAGAVTLEMKDGDLGVSIPGAGSSRNSISLSFEKLLYSIFPDNLIEMFYGGSGGPNLLSMITFAAAFAVGLVACRRKWTYKVEVILLFFQQAYDITMWLINIVINFTPIAVGCLVLKAFASQSLPELAKAFGSLGVLVAGLIFAFLFHIFVFLAALCYITTRFNPYKHIAGVFQAQTVALGCASSAVTLPTNMLCCERMGLRPQVVRFVLSLGATVSMDGSAIYIPSAIIWLAAQANVSMNFVQVLILAITATLASAGASPTPGTIPTLILAWGTVFPNTPYPEEGMAYLAAADWFIDRCVTATNITGDSFMARIVDKLIGDRELDVNMSAEEEVAEVDVEKQVETPVYTPTVDGSYSPFAPQQPQPQIYYQPAPQQ